MSFIKRLTVALVALVILLSSHTLAAASEDPEQTEAPGTEETPGETQESPPEPAISLEGVSDLEFSYIFETVCENDEAILLLDKRYAALRVVSKATGNYYDTKEMNGQRGNEYVKNNQKAEFVLTYYSDMDYGYTKTLDSYSMSVALKQMEYTPIENGVRIDYIVGEKDKVTLSLFPMFISKERLQELVLDHLSDTQLTEFFTTIGANAGKGYYTETSERYVRNWETYQKNDGKPTPVAQPVLNRIYNYFYVIGNYSEEELYYDNEAWGEDTPDTRVTFNVTMEYSLEGSELIVSIPPGGISINARKPEIYAISNINLNPYLLCGSVYDDGYILLPDGCGAIVGLDAGKAAAPAYDLPIYGTDVLSLPWFYREPYALAALPIMGLKRDDVAILAVIEKGAEVATVSANGAGKVDEFCKVSASFEITHMEKLPLLGNYGGQIRPKYANASYNQGIVMRYLFLEGSEANYTGMAKAYQRYLLDRGAIKQNDVPTDAPLFLDIIASVPVNRRFLGLVPYTAYESLTTFKQAEDILTSLKARGVNNIVAEYTAWTKGSFNAAPLKNISVISDIGGKKGLAGLLSYAEAAGVSLYPSVNLLKVGSASGLSTNKDIAKFLNNQKAFYPEYNLVTRVVNYANLLISPHYLPKYTESLRKGVSSLGITSLALQDAGTLLYGDYNTYRQVMRPEAAETFTESLAALSSDVSLLFHEANAYALPYASHITDVPTGDSGRQLTDYSVPFLQMTLENCVPYSLEAFNSGSLQDFQAYLLKAVETKSALKFNLTYAAEDAFNLANTFTSQYAYFQTQYSRWEGVIGDYYAAYNDFYKRVRDAEIALHEVLDGDMTRVTYTNGVTVYINYGESPRDMGGLTVPPLSFLITE